MTGESGRPLIFPTRILCPDCGHPMKLLRSNPRKFSCPNPDCNVIEVRLRKEKVVRILRQATPMRVCATGEEAL